MKGVMLVGAAVVLLLSGCGKVGEARDAVKKVSSAMEATRGMVQGAAGDATRTSVPLTEASVRRYYSAVVKLRQKYPGIEFESAMVAAIQAGSQGKDLKKIVPAETDLSFDDYSGLSGSILSVMAAGSLASGSAAIVPQMESSIKQMEAMDTSKMTPEQKAQLQQQIAAQKKALEQARAQAASPENRARQVQFEMVSRIRKEMGL